MVESEGVKKVRAQIRKAVSKWKSENPDWENSETMKHLESKVSPNTYTNYKSLLPLFCQWENTTPEQMINQREKQTKSDDRKERYYYEDRLIEFKQHLVNSFYKVNSINSVSWSLPSMNIF